MVVNHDGALRPVRSGTPGSKQIFVGVRDAHIPDWRQVAFEGIAVKDGRGSRVPHRIPWSVGSGSLGAQRQ
jgi:hypothetical protein